MVPFLIEATARLRAAGVASHLRRRLQARRRDPICEAECSLHLTGFLDEVVALGTDRLVFSLSPKPLSFHLQAIRETQGVLDLPPLRHGDAPCPKNEIADARISAYGKIHIVATVQSESVTSFRMAVVQ